MNTRCYFDMFDVCVSFDLGSLEMSIATPPGQSLDIVDSGLYDLPGGYSPLGKSAQDLYMYSSLQPA